MSEPVTTRRIVRVAPHQLGKIMGLLHGVFGVFVGLIVILVGLVSAGRHEGRVGFGLPESIAFGVLAPVLYGGMGYLFTIIGATLFNWAAGRLGGVQVTLASDSV